MATSMKILNSVGNLEKLLVSTVKRRCLATRVTSSSLQNKLIYKNTRATFQERHEQAYQRRILQASPVYSCSTSLQALNYSTDTTEDKTTDTSTDTVTDTPIDTMSSSSGQVIEDTDEPDILYKKLILEVKGHDKKVLASYERFVRSAADHLDVELAKVLKPKVDIFRQSVLASVHIYKKHQVQYEERTYYTTFEFQHLTGSTADTFLEYVQRNLPEGTAMKVTRHQVLQMPQHLKPPKKSKQLES